MWRAQLTVGYGIPRQVVLDGIRKEAELAMENKSVSSIPTWFLLRFLPPGSCSEFSCGWIASTKVQTIVSFSHCLWMWCLITALEIQLVPRGRSVRQGVANLEEHSPGRLPVDWQISGIPGPEGRPAWRVSSKEKCLSTVGLESIFSRSSQNP